MPGARGARNTTPPTGPDAGDDGLDHRRDGTDHSRRDRRGDEVWSGPLALVVLGDDAVPAFPLDAPNLLVGRAPDNDIVLGEPSVSARHARIDVRDGLVFLTDLGSTNGTFVAGRRVTGSVELLPGDNVALGRCLVRVERTGSGAARSTNHHPSPPRTEVSSAGASALHQPGPLPLSQTEWLPALRRAAEAPVSPAGRPLRVFISFDAADEVAAGVLGRWLSRLGHQLRTEQPPGSQAARAGRASEVDGQADPWAGRLLEVMWRTDVVLFVVSAAAGTSSRVHREIHLAGAERTPVVPVMVGSTELPDDLAYYLQRVAPVDLTGDPAGGLTLLERSLEGWRPKRVARPWQLARRVLAVTLVLTAVTLFTTAVLFVVM